MTTIALSAALNDTPLPGLLTFDGYTLAAGDAPADLRIITTDPADLRAAGDTIPIIAVTPARERVAAALDAGADDAVVGGDGPGELRARVRALLRRTAVDQPDPTPSVLTVGDLTCDLDTREVHRGTRRFSLTRTEFSLLRALMSDSPRVHSRADLVDRVWNNADRVTGNALEVYIGYLRKKTEADGEPRMITTHRGVGYSIVAA